MPETVNATLTWIDGMRFVGRADSGHGVLFDVKSRPDHLGATPMEMFLMSIAGCTAMDVVAILAKMRQPVEHLEVAITGERAETNPKYYTALELTYRLRGHGLDHEKVARAVDLSHSTYCSASASLRPDCKVTSRIEIAES
jgi:putative redox protein